MFVMRLRIPSAWELLPAMAALLERVGEIDRRLEGMAPGAGQPEAGEPVAP